MDVSKRYIYHRQANNPEDRMRDLAFFAKTKQALKDLVLRFNFKRMAKPFLIMTGVYGTALIAWCLLPPPAF
ncbi:MAG: hypothetical protein LBG76_01165 [Treponema sp.]|jgi:hypothetical protein|nr:hypothetical protein [Treponema sp.]